MDSGHLVFRVHAIRRVFERQISEDDILHVLATGEVVENYPNDTPYPSRLVLGWCGSRPIHIVIADNAGEQETIVVPVYEPDAVQWEPGFKRRRL